MLKAVTLWYRTGEDSKTHTHKYKVILMRWHRLIIGPAQPLNTWSHLY